QLIQRLKKASKAGSVVDDLEIRLVNLSHLSPHQIGSHSRQNKKGVRFGFSLTPFLARARYGVGSRNSWHPSPPERPKPSANSIDARTEGGERPPGIKPEQPTASRRNTTR